MKKPTSKLAKGRVARKVASKAKQAVAASVKRSKVTGKAKGRAVAKAKANRKAGKVEARTYAPWVATRTPASEISDTMKIRLNPKFSYRNAKSKVAQRMSKIGGMTVANARAKYGVSKTDLSCAEARDRLSLSGK